MSTSTVRQPKSARKPQPRSTAPTEAPGKPTRFNELLRGLAGTATRKEGGRRAEQPKVPTRRRFTPVTVLDDVLRPREKIDWVHVVQQGIPARIVGDAGKRFGMSKERLALVLGMAKPTLNEMARKDRVLDAKSSDVFKDATLVLEKALRFSGGDPAAMNAWLNSHVPALGCRPIELLGSKDGRELVDATLERAMAGVFG
jgi:putative toxin-antitoxin system antitoxin component (TIGR02293 family)